MGLRFHLLNRHTHRFDLPGDVDRAAAGRLHLIHQRPTVTKVLPALTAIQFSSVTFAKQTIAEAATGGDSEVIVA